MDVIVGAGVSGLAYAGFSKNECLLLEKDAEIGGYCKTIKWGDFVKLSEAMGATARRVKTQEEFEKAFADALKSKTPFVIDCIIDSDDKVWPMVAPGKPINESFDEEDYNATQGGN